MNAPARGRSASKELRVQELLYALEYDDAEIASLDAQYLYELRYATEAKINTQLTAIDNQENKEELSRIGLTTDNSYEDSKDKVTINLRNTIRLVKVGVATSGKFVGQTGVCISGSAKFDHNSKYKDIPSRRGIDYFSLMWSDSAVYGNEVSGGLTCDVFHVISSSKKGASTCTLGDRFMSENTKGIKQWGMEVNLPNNSMANRYGNFTINGQVKVYSTTTVEALFAYAHSISADEITLGLTDLSISFGSKESYLTVKGSL